MSEHNILHLSGFLAVLTLISISSLWCCVGTENGRGEDGRGSLVVVPIGAALDLRSPLGLMAELCMEMAVADFYGAHPDCATRLQLHVRSAGSALDANLAALDLVYQEEVQGIITADESTQEAMFAELGQEAHVPVISFLSRNYPSSYTENHYLLRTTPADAIRTQTLAAICQTFEWHRIAILYEDRDSGYQFLSYMNQALQEVEIKIAFTIAIPSSASDSTIRKELNKLATKQTTIFLVHMINPSLAFRLFNLAKEEGVMSEGYAWLITDSISVFMNSMDLTTRDSMEGVIGIRPYVNHSKELIIFRERFKRNVITRNKTSLLIMDLNVHGLWAYDAVTALATAVEKIMPTNFTARNMNKTMNGLHKMSARISSLGTSLLNELSNTTFNGLSGEFKLVDGKLKFSGYEIFNLFGSGEKTLGFWTPDKGVVREWSSTTKTKGLKNVIWPGDSVKKPRGWDMPRNLRVGIPPKLGFPEFLDKTFDSTTAEYHPTGFAIDIFLAALDLLPFSIIHEFHFFDRQDINYSYDDMLEKVPEEYDMVVGDTTIWAPRAKHVDFSIPYSEAGVVLVVKNEKPIDMWIFVKPLKWDLWLAIILTCIFMGVVLRVLEHNLTHNQVNSIRRHNEHLGIYLSPVSILAFPERNMVSNKWSFFVLVFWLFMAYILMQSYTANLSAILTVDQLKFAFSDNYYVGYQEASFMKTFLTKQLHISESRLRSYTSAEDYHKAMSLGGKKGGIDAIFDEIPYMKILLKKYDSLYKMVGPTYRTGGFGFAFSPNSPLVPHFSKAILEITQGPNMTSIERKNFGPGYSSQDPLSSTISQQTSGLTLFDFAGLFIIIGSVTVFALFCSETTVGQILTRKTEHFLQDFFKVFRTSSDETIRDAASDNGDLGDTSGEDYSHDQHAMNNNITSPTGDGVTTDVVEEITELRKDDQVKAHETRLHHASFADQSHLQSTT